MINPFELPSCAIKGLKSKLLPEKTAIYFAISKQEVFYVGSTINLKQRFQGHHRNEDFFKLSCIDTAARIAWFDGEIDNLIIVEKQLIELYSPVINHTHNPNRSVCWEPELKLEVPYLCHLAGIDMEFLPMDTWECIIGAGSSLENYEFTSGDLGKCLSRLGEYISKNRKNVIQQCLEKGSASGNHWQISWSNLTIERAERFQSVRKKNRWQAHQANKQQQTAA